jgi:acetyl-CoA C-acetyltransferase
MKPLPPLPGFNKNDGGGDEAKWRELLKKPIERRSHCHRSSGGRQRRKILMTMMYELRRRGGGFGICGICGGLAQGDAVVIRVD